MNRIAKLTRPVVTQIITIAVVAVAASWFGASVAVKHAQAQTSQTGVYMPVDDGPKPCGSC